MEKKIFACGEKKATLYAGSRPGAPLILLNSYEGGGEEVVTPLREISAPACSLLMVGGLDWDRDLSPWYCPPLSKNAPPCTGGADAYLDLLLTEILPKAEAMLPCAPSFVGIAGYSLAGLFALYAAYRCTAFDRVASVSGSLWFPDFKEYALTHEMKRRPARLYLSLGDREAHTRNTVLRTVRENTEALAEHYKGLGLSVTWELNPGNHFHDAALRTARGIRAVLL